MIYIYLDVTVHTNIYYQQLNNKMPIYTTNFTFPKKVNEQKRSRFDKKQNKVVHKALKPKQIRGKNIRMVENAVPKMTTNEIAREYWKLGLYLIEHSKVKLGMQYLDASIHYRQENGQSHYHEQGIYNKMLDKHFKEKRY